MAALVFGATLLSMQGGPARAADAPAPPPGWEAPPPLATKPAKAPRAPACCQHDAICCSRQTSIDQARIRRVVRMIEVRIADLPKEEVQEAPKDGPGIAGVRPLKIVDGNGRSFPWLDGPVGEIRLMPPGQCGELTIGKDAWPLPFYAEPEFQGMGSGRVLGRFTDKPADKGRSLIAGSLSYLSFDRAEGDGIVVERVEGNLEGTPDLRVTRRAHVVAAPILPGRVNAYQDKQGDEVRVVFVLPEVLLGFEAKETKVAGGFLRVRGEATETFTTYTIPMGPGRSGVGTFVIMSRWLRRWFPPKNQEKLPASQPGGVAVSQTSVEAEPRARVFLYEPEPDIFE
ncbi:hypothetical protein [Polyangium mundeleinium]|uniref:Uncharacterized protein n=1 Tax=Polyangium mundeleinium TaxID=2995306 RepID=A0ABT5F4G7_9BACT|nr:hypothetical protein [Polyangium mundeleinium]MDC0747970.1 hypothetical protein [Polyangium mundeleinium]